MVTEVVKDLLDIASIGALVGWFLGSLPTVATLLTIVWICVRLWESNTVRGWLGKEPL